ncbi:hypothetical protein E4U59_007097 [Claviceps monticola]|nr:hypothetical protein E4U59_007097 [Claviceps monticola]
MISMVIVLLSTVFLAVMYTWHRAYPRPYEDIPYSTQSARRLLGDISDIIQLVRDGNDPENSIADRCRRLNSPIVQLFFEPFSRPLIFLDDTAAVSNIVCTRTKELNRASITVRTLLYFFLRSRILKQTTPEWRAQRQLWNDSMGQDFLHRIAAPKTYKVAQQLLELFQLKTSIGNSRPFSVDTDFNLHIRFHDDFCLRQPAFVDSPAALPAMVKGGLFRAIEYLNSTMNTNIINEHIRRDRERFAYSGSQQVDGSKTYAIDIVFGRE